MAYDDTQVVEYLRKTHETHVLSDCESHRPYPARGWGGLLSIANMVVDLDMHSLGPNACPSRWATVTVSTPFFRASVT
jgi:hypothetical protein